MSISLGEILMILLVALLVIKPERLPEVASLLARWIRAAQRLISKIKHELDPLPAQYSYQEEKKKNDGS